MFNVRDDGKIEVNRACLHSSPGYKEQITALNQLGELMRKSWNDSQKERLEIERVRAEQKMQSRVLEAEATAILKADAKKRQEQENLLYLEAGDE